MSSGAIKRVAIYRFDLKDLDGYINLSSYLADSALEMLTRDGAVERLPYPAIKAVCFVGDGFPRFDLFDSDLLFDRRPRQPGLWARFRFRDGDQIDGILPQDPLGWPLQGYLITPPRPSAARQKVFIPRLALSGIELQALIRAAVPRKSAPATVPERQLEMFVAPPLPDPASEP